MDNTKEKTYEEKTYEQQLEEIKQINKTISSITAESIKVSFREIIRDILSCDNLEDTKKDIIKKISVIKKCFFKWWDLVDFEYFLKWVNTYPECSNIFFELFHSELRKVDVSNIWSLAFLWKVFLNLDIKNNFNIKSETYIKKLLNTYKRRKEKLLLNSWWTIEEQNNFAMFWEFLNKIAIISNDDTEEWREIASLILDNIKSNLWETLDKKDEFNFDKKFIKHSSFLHRRSVLNRDIDYIVTTEIWELANIYEKWWINSLLSHIEVESKEIKEKINYMLNNLKSIIGNEWWVEWIQWNYELFKKVLSFNTTTMIGMLYYKMNVLLNISSKVIINSNKDQETKNTDNQKLNTKKGWLDLLKNIIESNLVWLRNNPDWSDISEEYLSNIINYINTWNTPENIDNLFLFDSENNNVNDYIDWILENLSILKIKNSEIETKNQEEKDKNPTEKETIDSFDYKTIHYLILYTNSIDIDTCIKILEWIINFGLYEDLLTEHVKNSIIENILKKTSKIENSKKKIELLEKVYEYIENYHKSEINYDFWNIIEDLIISYLKHDDNSTRLKERLWMLSYHYYLVLEDKKFESEHYGHTNSYRKIEKIWELISLKNLWENKKSLNKWDLGFFQNIASGINKPSKNFRLGLKFIIENKWEYKSITEWNLKELIISEITINKDKLVPKTDSLDWIKRVDILKNTWDNIWKIIKNNIFFWLIKEFKIFKTNSEEHRNFVDTVWYWEKLYEKTLEKSPDVTIAVKYLETDSEKVEQIFKENKKNLEKIFADIIDYEDIPTKIYKLINKETENYWQIVRDNNWVVRYIELLFRFKNWPTPFLYKEIIERISAEADIHCPKKNTSLKNHESCKHKFLCKNNLSKLVEWSAEESIKQWIWEFKNSDMNDTLLWINIDSYSLEHEEFYNFLDQNKGKIPNLVVEIIENLPTTDAYMKKIRDIHKLGYKIAIDDYWAWNTKAILNNLHDIVNIIKIDKEFAIWISKWDLQSKKDLVNSIQEIIEVKKDKEYTIIIEWVEDIEKIKEITSIYKEKNPNITFLYQWFYKDSWADGKPISLNKAISTWKEVNKQIQNQVA